MSPSSATNHRKLYKIFGGIFLVISTLVIADIASDYRESNTLTLHIVLECLIGVLSFSAFVLILKQLNSFKQSLEDTQKELASSQDQIKNLKIESARWKKDAEVFIVGLAKQIDEQFERWKFSKAEKDVALLMIKGLSINEIANIRQTSEKTVRTQSISIYAKSGLHGKNELSAFFLEDLLSP